MYDCIIVGGGPAGLTASIYLLMAKKKVLLLEKMSLGGQVGQTSTILNYPSQKKITGQMLASEMAEHAMSLGLEYKLEDAHSFDLNNKIKIVKTQKAEYETKTLIFAMGAYARELNLPNEKDLTGKGISYCALCDGNFFRNKNVGVVGGGNSSFEDVLYLSGLAKKVYLIHRREGFRGNEEGLEKILELSKTGKVEILTNKVVSKLIGSQKLEEIVLKNTKTEEEEPLKLDGLFVAIGRQPDTRSISNEINLDEKGYILTDDSLSTNVEGVFSAGDIRHKTVRQIVTACGDGATVAFSVIQYLQNQK